MQIKRCSTRYFQIKGLTPEQAQEVILRMASTLAEWLTGLEAGSLFTNTRWADFDWRTWEKDLHSEKAPENFYHRFEYLRAENFKRLAQPEGILEKIAHGVEIGEDSSLHPVRLSWDPNGTLSIYDDASGDPWGPEHQARWFPTQYREQLVA
jgi:hypothetical protein